MGSGPASYLAGIYHPSCVVLISPFSSLKSAVKDKLPCCLVCLKPCLCMSDFNNVENLK
jgi:hypothetical protein